MPTIAIDPDSCTHCWACVETCPARIFVQGQATETPSLRFETHCISCGHCVAICPHNAISHSAYPPGTVQPVDSAILPGPDAMMEALRLRRSVRVFSNRPVEKELLEKLVEALGLAPSAHNLRTTEYLVIQNPDTLKMLSERVVAHFTKVARQLANPVFRSLYGLLYTKSEVESAMHLLPDLELLEPVAREGYDPILRGAPCLVVAHDKPNVNFPESNAVLAIHNATLAAQAFGLGSFQVGYLVGACARDKSVRDLIPLPTGHRVYAALALGHPRREFRRWLRRQPPKVTWV